MLQARKPQGGYTKVILSFGRGLKAKRHYSNLLNLFPSIQHALRTMGHDYDARVLSRWHGQARQRSAIGELPDWELELDAKEWQALSRGLRAQGPKRTERLSFYAWTMTHKVEHHERD